jgi:hypothetical protein
MFVKREKRDEKPDEALRSRKGKCRSEIHQKMSKNSEMRSARAARFAAEAAAPPPPPSNPEWLSANAEALDVVAQAYWAEQFCPTSTPGAEHPASMDDAGDAVARLAYRGTPRTIEAVAREAVSIAVARQSSGAAGWHSQD